MKRYRSHVRNVFHGCYVPDMNGHVQWCAARWGNYDLAHETDRLETLDELRPKARNRELFETLIGLGACLDGLKAVAVMAGTWYELGVLIAQQDGEEAESYWGWCREVLACEYPDELSDVISGFDGEMIDQNEPRDY